MKSMQHIGLLSKKIAILNKKGVLVVNHMIVANYFPEPYEGRIECNEREYSIAELATLRELPAILKRYGDWVVTTDGIDYLTGTYFIAKDRFDELDWFEHMEEKTWVNMMDFRAALYAGRDLVKHGIICLCESEEKE